MINYDPIPILFEIGNIKIYSWGVMIFMALIISIYLSLKKLKKIIPEKETHTIIFLVLVGGFIGARLFHVMFNFDYFSNNFLDIFRFWKGGMVSYGGLLGGFIFSFLYIIKKKLNFSIILNAIIPYLALGFFIGRIGCFLNWCCYGIASTLPWAIKVGEDIARHPTQIYLLIGNFIIFFILFNMNKNSKVAHKNTFLFFIILYSILRLFVDFFREVSVFNYIFFGGLLVSSLLYYCIQKLK